MKLNENFILRDVAGTWVVLPINTSTMNFNGMLTLNESGVLLWKTLEQGGNVQALAETLTKEYNVSMEVALTDAEEFIQKLLQIGCLET